MRRLLFLLVLMLAAPVAAQTRGYVSRACGFDMDRDGTFSEAADCNVCDGVTTDVDNDGQAEDLIYVDCDAGENDGSCGAYNDPCATIGYAYNTRANGTGEEDIICFKGTCSSEGDALALTGGAPKTTYEPSNDHTCSTTCQSGPLEGRTCGSDEDCDCPTGSYEVPRTGSQKRSFCHPHDPAMIVGWDADNDGEYPPYDTDDTAIIEGDTNDYDQTFTTEANMELAHFTVENYGQGDGIVTGENRGFILTNSYSRYHDLMLVNINEGSCMSSGTIVFSFFGVDQVFTAIENVSAVPFGGYFVRGAANNNTGYGPIRFQNITAQGRGIHELQCSGGDNDGGDCFTTDDCPGGGTCATYSPCGCGAQCGTTFLYLWGWFDGIEAIDNHHSCDLKNWNGWLNNAYCNNIGNGGCNRDWWVVNNRLEMSRGSAACYAGTYCQNADSRTVRDIIWDRNEWIWDHELCSGDNATPCTDDSDCSVAGGTCSSTMQTIAPIQAFFVTTTGDSDNEYCEDITFSNNIIDIQRGSIEAGFAYYASGTAYTGSHEIAVLNNTFWGQTENASGGVEHGYVSFYPVNADGYHQNFTVRNNIMGGGSGSCRQVYLRYTLSNFDSDYNVFDSDCTYFYPSSNYTSLSAWTTATQNEGECGAGGCDQNSAECTPTFATWGGVAYKLDDTDTCALGNGVDVSAFTPWSSEHDFDNDSRPLNTTWDIGADEWVTAPVSDTIYPTVMNWWNKCAQ